MKAASFSPNSLSLIRSSSVFAVAFSVRMVWRVPSFSLHSLVSFFQEGLPPGVKLFAPNRRFSLHNFFLPALKIRNVGFFHHLQHRCRVNGTKLPHFFLSHGRAFCLRLILEMITRSTITFPLREISFLSQNPASFVQTVYFRSLQTEEQRK